MGVPGGHMESNDVKLPRQSELGVQTLGFLAQRFVTLEDLSMAYDLKMELENGGVEMGNKLHDLQRQLGKFMVSRSSRSIYTGASIDKLLVSVEYLGLLSSSYDGTTSNSREIQKILAQDLPSIVKQLQKSSVIRQYAETALKLEALVGDLEDAVLCLLNRPTGNHDWTTQQVSVHSAAMCIDNIEDVLVSVLTSQPQWSHLLKVVDTRVDKIFALLRPHVLADYRSVLASVGWPPKIMTSKIEGGMSCIPNPLVLMQGEDREIYSRSFLALCALQRVQMRRENRRSISSGKKDDSIGLWAIDELVSPLASKIEHHFSRWDDQPEFMFALVYKITRDFIEGMDLVLQSLIDSAGVIGCSAKEAWIFAMIKLLSGYLDKKVLPVLAAKYKEKGLKEEAISAWLHIMDNIIAFDTRMQSLVSQETYQFPEESELGFSVGMSVLSVFNNRSGWLRLWAKIELKDAWKKLKAELKHERAWLIDTGVGQRNSGSKMDVYLPSTREDYIAPEIAEFVLKVTWEIMQRGRGLLSMSSQILFIRSGAMKFLRHFFSVLLHRHERIGLSLDGSDESLIRICQLINSARFCKTKLEEWNDDGNILELKVAESQLNNTVLGDCGFFDEEVKSLDEMETDWLMQVISHLFHRFENLSVDYFYGTEQFKGVVNAAGDMPVTHDCLVEAWDTLRSQLLLIRQHLNPNDFLDLWRSVAAGLDRYISRMILTRNITFSDGGALQFLVDTGILFQIFGSLCARPESFFPLIGDLLILLKMDRKNVEWVISDGEKARSYIRSNGIAHMAVDQCLNILRNRILSS